jgi:hypothetical protein
MAAASKATSLDRHPFAHVDFGDGAVAAGAQLVLHLHGFDDHYRLARADAVADGDRHADDLARHRRRQTLRSRRCASAVVRAAIAAAAVEGDWHRQPRDVHRQLTTSPIRRDTGVSRPHIVHNQRQRVRADARHINMMGMAVDGDCKTVARPGDDDLPPAPADLELVLHQ